MFNKKGFTLIELLVVIAIIAILASVAFALLSGSTSKAKTSSFKQEISSIQPALVTICDGSSGAAIPDSDVSGSPIRAASTHAAGVIVQDCQTTSFNVTFAPASPGSGGSCTGATVTENGTVFTGC